MVSTMTTVFKSFLRDRQPKKAYKSRSDEDVKIYAPAWVQDCLNRIGKKLDGATIEVMCGREIIDRLPLGSTFSLRDLQILSRSELSNTTGKINFQNYPGLSKEFVYGLKDLVRQCIIVGKDRTNNYGGYPRGAPLVPQSADVYICDLTGLQFQNEHNSGRLVLIGEEDQFPKGEFDEAIFQNVVGEPKKPFGQVSSSKRYVRTKFTPKSGDVFFDTVAYKRFVAKDVVLCGIALDGLIAGSDTSASADKGTGKKPIVFKFLKYGSGFFAGKFGPIIEEHILEGVIDGLEELFANYDVRHIGAVEFTFYSQDDVQEARLKKLKETHNVEYRFSYEDALKSTWPEYITATTNCADPHAALGNKMGYGSVDGAIASNLVDQGDKFCPLVNAKMRMEFVDIKPFKGS